jgi:DNA-binding MarR family transcriptional regulator
MSGNGEADLVQDVLGSAHAFSAAVGSVVETRLLREVAGAKLSFPQLNLLRLVERADTHSISDVAALLRVTKAAASKTVDKLVRRRLLRRSERTEDRRETQLSLTESGRRLLAAYEAARDQAVLRSLEGFEPARLREMAQTLDCLTAALVRGQPEAERCLLCGGYLRENCRLRLLTGGECFYRRRREPQDEN